MTGRSFIRPNLIQVKLLFFRSLAGRSLLAAVCGLSGAGCHAAPGASPAGANGVTPVYNKQTGVLEQLVADTKGDGRADMRAHMSGAHVNSVEIDRNRDGRPDRWEYYDTSVGGQRAGARSVLARAEEANGADEKVTRWEYYENGVIRRIEEDTDADGKADKWELYDHGALVRMDLDLAGRGFPDRRLIYRGDGTLDRTEVDAAGDGRFKSPDGSKTVPAVGRREE